MKNEEQRNEKLENKYSSLAGDGQNNFFAPPLGGWGVLP